MYKILVVAAADSHIKWCCAVAEKISKDVEIEIFVPNDQGLDVDGNILLNVGVEIPYGEGSLESLTESHDLSRYHGIITILFPVLFGKLHSMVANWLAEVKPVRRPVILTGFPGITVQPPNGIATRYGADIICVNSKKDMSEAKELLRGLSLDDDVVLSTTYPFIKKTNVRNIVCSPNSGRHIVFTTQPHWPGKLNERLWILQRLVDAASAYPEDHFSIKLRMPTGKKTIHPEKYHYETIFPRLGVDKPHNLNFIYGEMGKVFRETDLHLTLASTAAVESIAMDIPTAIIGDFGISFNYGVSHFVGSGLIKSIEDAVANGAAAPDKSWLEQNGLGQDDSFDLAVQRFVDLVDKQESLKRPEPLTPLYYNERNYAYAFSRALDLPEERRKAKLPAEKRKSSTTRRVGKVFKYLLPPFLFNPMLAAWKTVKQR